MCDRWSRCEGPDIAPLATTWRGFRGGVALLSLLEDETLEALASLGCGAASGVWPVLAISPAELDKWLKTRPCASPRAVRAAPGFGRAQTTLHRAAHAV